LTKVCRFLSPANLAARIIGSRNTTTLIRRVTATKMPVARTARDEFFSNSPQTPGDEYGLVHSVIMAASPLAYANISFTTRAG
jgi:hypothetical protein